MVSRVVSHYRIIRKLGAGGMGEVYLAEDTNLSRKVAIKMLPLRSAGDEQARRRLIREAKAAARLDHPNICAIHEVDEGVNGNFIIMQYVEGETLATIIHDRKLELIESLEIATQILDALSEAHSHGIIHRDIKPQNIIVTPRGQVKVLDFGLAKTSSRDRPVESEAETQSMLTESGAVMGTVGYMSPEQVRGAPLDARSDLFSLGALLYECLTGHRAFSGNNSIDICAQVIHVDPKPPSEHNPLVTQQLESIVLKALAKDPGTRYQSAHEMIVDLRRVLDRLTASEHAAAETPAPVAVPRPTGSLATVLSFVSDPQKRRWLVAGGIMAIAIGLAVFLLMPRLWRAAPHQPLPEARRFYDEGANALRDGAYYQASKALERAVSLDGRFALAHARLAEAWAELDYGERAKDELVRVSALVPDRSKLPQFEALYLTAITDTATRDFAGAIESYQQIAQQVAEPEKPFAYVDLGRAYEKNDDIKRAIECYEEASRREQQYGAPFLRLGILHLRKQELKAADEAFDKAQAIYEGLSNLEGVAEVLYQRGFLLNNIDKVGEARPFLEKALQLAQTTGNKYQQIRSMLQLSSVNWTEGDSDKARQLATEAVGLAQAEKMENLAANGLVDLGNAFFSRGEYSDAERYFKQALEFAQRNQGRRGEARALLSLGSLNIQRENVDEGIRYVEQARGFYEQGGYHKEVALCLTLLARANRQKGDYAGAYAAFEDQLRVAEQIGDSALMASSHASMGTLLGYYQENYPAGLRQFDESYKINESLGAKLNLGYDSLNRANMLWQLGRYGEAGSAFDQASSIADRPETGNKELAAMICSSRARAALSEERFSEAVTLSQKALDLAGTQYSQVIIDARNTLGLARCRSGAVKLGRTFCEEAAARANQIGNPLLISKSLLSLAEVALEAGEAERALTSAKQAQAMLARLGKQDSEWRALLIAARASERGGDTAAARDYTSRGRNLLEGLAEKFGADFYASYVGRRDVQTCRKLLDRFVR